VDFFHWKQKFEFLSICLTFLLLKSIEGSDKNLNQEWEPIQRKNFSYVLMSLDVHIYKNENTNFVPLRNALWKSYERFYI
jgi:DMSO/TMAO reductase YedYZ heme-binding membrane subunit